MQPCPNCGRTELTPAGNCANCGVFRGGQAYGPGQPGTQPYGQPASAPPAGQPYGHSGQPGPGQPGPGQYGYQADPYQQPYQGQPYQGQPNQGQPNQAHQPYGGYADHGYHDPNAYQAPNAYQPPPRRPSTVPLIVLSVIAVILVVGIVGVVLVRANDSGNGNDNGNGDTNTGTAAGVDKCVIGKWRVTSAKEKVDVDGTLAEFTASGGTVDLRADGTGTFDYGTPGVTYKGTVSGQPVTITVSGRSTFSYKTVDGSFTFSNAKADGTAVLKVNGVTATTIPLDMDTKPVKYTCDGNSMTHETDLATTQLSK